MKAPETPRQCRRALNKMEGWFRDNSRRYSPTHQVVLRSAFEEASTSTHVAALAGYLREWVRPETQDRAPFNTSTTRPQKSAGAPC